MRDIFGWITRPFAGLFASLLTLVSVGVAVPALLALDPDGDGDGGDGSDGDDTGDGDGDGGDDTDSDGDDGDDGDEKKLTQAEVDAILSKRLKDERRKWDADAKAAADREKMDEAQRAQAEKEDAEKRANDAISTANKRLVTADVKTAASAAGVRPERVAAFLRHVDTDDIEVDDDGNVDDKAVKSAVDKALKDVPEFKAGKGAGKSGGDLNGGDPPKRATSIEDAVAKRYANA